MGQHTGYDDLQTHIYFYTFTAGDFQSTRRMVILK